MPYTVDSKNLPSYISNKSEGVKAKWVSLFNKIYKEKGEEEAFIVANTWLKRHLSSEAKLIKRSFIELEMDSSKGFIKRSDDGEDYISFILNSTVPHKDGRVFTEAMLQKWAEDINKGEVVIGDIDHQHYDKALATLTDDQVRHALKKKPGIAKAVKAIYDKGKLWVRAMIDKRYRKLIEKAKGVSVEALCSWADNIAVDGDILGFTFNVNTEPADSMAGIYDD